VWTQHYPKEATDSPSENFELVVFASSQIKEGAPYLGETRLAVGVSTRKPPDHETVEAFVGQEV
jgi:hypothetical protein